MACSPEIAFEVNLPAPMERSFLHDRQRWPCRRGDEPLRAGQRADAVGGIRHGDDEHRHDAHKEPQAFVMSNPQAVDYAYRAVHLTATTAKRIAATLLA